MDRDFLIIVLIAFIIAALVVFIINLFITNELSNCTIKEYPQEMFFENKLTDTVKDYIQDYYKNVARQVLWIDSTIVQIEVMPLEEINLGNGMIPQWKYITGIKIWRYPVVVENSDLIEVDSINLPEMTITVENPDVIGEE